LSSVTARSGPARDGRHSISNAPRLAEVLAGTPDRRRTVKMKSTTTTTDAAAKLLEQRLAYSVDEAATVTGLSRDLLYDQMRTGKLGYLKVGRRRIITKEHLAAFLAMRSP